MITPKAVDKVWGIASDDGEWNREFWYLNMSDAIKDAEHSVMLGEANSLIVGCINDPLENERYFVEKQDDGVIERKIVIKRKIS